VEDNRYYGIYARFDVASAKEAPRLLSADNIVGDRYEIYFTQDGARPVAHLKNRFGAEVGYLNEETSYQLSVCQARGWTIRPLLAFVGCLQAQSAEDGDQYWGQFAIMCNDPYYDGDFDTFEKTIAAALGRGRRPDINLGKKGVDQVISSHGTWLPTKTVPLPMKKQDAVFLKNEIRNDDRMVESIRKHPVGCTIISYTVIAIIIAAVLFWIFA